MDRRRPLTELESEELITRLNDANSSLNEKLTTLRKLVKYNQEALLETWKINEALQAHLLAERVGNLTRKQDNLALTEIVKIHEETIKMEEETSDILQKTIDSLVEQLATQKETQ